MKKKVFITGSTGFLGTHVVAELKKKYRVATQKVDLTTSVPTIKNIHAVVHLASNVSIAQSIKNPTEHIEKNLAMTLNVLEACRAQKTKPLFIYMSSDRVYGKTQGTVTETSPTFPIEPYVASKLMSEAAVITYANQFDIPYIILRPSAFFGERQPRRSFISDVIQKMIVNNKVTVGPLTGVKNFTYVGNIADAVLAAVTAKGSAHNRIYNIGGKPLALSQVLVHLKKIVEKRLNKTISINTDRSIKLPTRNEIGAFRLSTAAAGSKLHWKEKTLLQEGLERTVDFFLNNEKKI